MFGMNLTLQRPYLSAGAPLLTQNLLCRHLVLFFLKGPFSAGPRMKSASGDRYRHSVKATGVLVAQTQQRCYRTNRTASSWRGGLGLTGRVLRGPYLGQVLLHDLNEVGHGEVHDVVPPGGLQDHVRPEEVIASEEAGSETFPLALL